MLVILGILLYVVVLMTIVSKVFGRRLVPETARSGMIMELPPYHKPHWKHIAKEALLKAWDIFKRALLGRAMTSAVSKAEALAFMCACTFNIPCVMALSTTYRESHSLKWTARIAAFYVCGALILACIVYHIAVLFV